MSLLAGHLLHAVARLATKLAPPARAKLIVDRAGRWVPPLESALAAEAYLAELSGAGTCLTRALALAARWQGAEVVIGGTVATPFQNGFLGHAWVTNGGITVGHDSSVEIARL